MSEECPSERTLVDYAAAKLDDAMRQRLTTHLEACATCRDRLLRIQRQSRSEGTREGPLTPTMGWHAPDPDEPMDVSDELASCFDFTLLTDSSRAEALGCLGKYDVLRVVGHGGMGVVFEAYDERLRRTVAIKVLNRNLSSNQTARRRFIREARAAAAINHPNVVTIYAVEEQRDLPFIVMECVHGDSLRDRLRAVRQLDSLTALRIGTQIAAGLAAAHAQGVIHRDVKPGNVMLEGADRVKITDFGVARATSDNVELTSKGAALGTPSYMAPEQVSSNRVDARADLFALGCVMYALVRGRSPFLGQNVLDTAHRVLHTEPPRLDGGADGIPPFYADLVARLLEKDPDRRYQSAAEVADVLNRHLTQINLATSDQLPELLAPTRTKAVLHRPRWTFLAVAGLLALALLGLAGAFAVSRWVDGGNGSSPSPPVSVADQPREPAQLEPRLPVRVRTVAKSGGADFASLSDALRGCGPGTLIRVLDAAEYDEAVVLSGADQFRELTLESTSGATWVATAGGIPLTVRDVPRLTVRGFRLPLQGDQHGIQLSGDCPALVLEDLELNQPADSSCAVLALTPGTRGTRQEPVLLRRLTVRAGWMGLVIYGLPDKPICWVRVEGCRFFGAGKGQSVEVILENAAEDIALTGNHFCTGDAGISISMPQPHTLQRLAVVQNTFFQLGHWLRWNATQAEGQQVDIARNLVIEADGVQCPGDGDLARFASWFRGNVWEIPDGGQPNDLAEAERFALVRPRVQVASRDPAHPDFLRTDDPALPGAPADGPPTPESAPRPKPQASSSAP